MKRGLIALFVFAVLMLNTIGVSASLEQQSNTNLPLKESYWMCYGPEGKNQGPMACFLATEEGMNSYCPKEEGFTGIKFENIMSMEECDMERKNEIGMLFSAGFKKESYDDYLANMAGRASGNIATVPETTASRGLADTAKSKIQQYLNSIMIVKDYLVEFIKNLFK